MSCIDVYKQLALLVYGDLSLDETAAVEQHLAGCTDCRAERAALENTQSVLDAVETPAVSVDAQHIVALAGRNTVVHTRWRRIGAFSAIAAAFAGLAFMKLEVQVNNGAVAVRWGTPPAAGAPSLSPTELAAMHARVRELQELSRVLIADVDERDRARQGDITVLNTRLEQLAQQTAGRLRETERGVDALYVAQFKPTGEGAKQ